MPSKLPLFLNNNHGVFLCEVLDFIKWRYNTKRHWLIIDCAKDTCVRLYLSSFSVRLVCAVYALLSSEFTMPPKPKRSSKKADQAGVCSPWLEKFCSKHEIPAALVEVLAEHQVTSEAILADITEQDFSDMRLVVGQKIILRRVIPEQALGSVYRSRTKPNAAFFSKSAAASFQARRRAG